MPSWTYFPRASLPKPLDVVWCYFPIVEDVGNPAPKPRPALVRRASARDGKPYVEVAYGTSQTDRRSERALYIANLTDMVEIGLPQATVFDLDRTALVPWAEEWFGLLDGQGPVIGKLNARWREYLKLITRGRR
jgi:hypothetical protein